MESSSSFAERYRPRSESNARASNDGENETKARPLDDPFLDDASRQSPGTFPRWDAAGTNESELQFRQAEVIADILPQRLSGQGEYRRQMAAQIARRRVSALQRVIANSSGPARDAVPPAKEESQLPAGTGANGPAVADPGTLPVAQVDHMLEAQRNAMIQAQHAALRQAKAGPQPRRAAEAAGSGVGGSLKQAQAAYFESLRRTGALNQQALNRQALNQGTAAHDSLATLPLSDAEAEIVRARARMLRRDAAPTSAPDSLPTTTPQNQRILRDVRLSRAEVQRARSRAARTEAEVTAAGNEHAPVAPPQAEPVAQQTRATMNLDATCIQAETLSGSTGAFAKDPAMVAQEAQVKRSLSGYVPFANEQREDVRRESRDFDFSQVAKALSDGQRAAYKDKAAADEKRVEQEKRASTAPEAGKAASRPHHPSSATTAFMDHSSATRISTDTVVARALRAQYPSLELTIVNQYNCQLLAYAAAGHATVEPIADSDADPAVLSWKLYVPAARRLDGGNGALGEQHIFGKYLYRWSGHEFIVYQFDGRDGAASYPQIRNFYILSPKTDLADRLVMAAGKWSDDLHEEILIFDQGSWSKSKELYASVREARWENVILEDSMKKAVIEDHLSFFRSRDTYTGLKVPWKRGIIYYGPPGNGKTISIKATMNMLYRQTPPIPTLYVRTLASFMGPEYSVRLIFAYARRYAPCYLVFEDLDTIVSDTVRSYFLNEVDGLKNNDGIFMVGSTNHLDRLDPGISKRPSRFDRKYFFPDPNLEQRIAYCHFWQKKLGDSDDVEFPDKLCKPIAEITDKFSFAYMQEAFVAALLTIARESDSQRRHNEAVSPGGSEEEWVGVDAPGDFDTVSDVADEGSDDDDDELDKYVLWVEMKKQVAILREGMEDKDG